jgi:hypothetical protein
LAPRAAHCSSQGQASRGRSWPSNARFIRQVDEFLSTDELCVEVFLDFDGYGWQRDRRRVEGIAAKCRDLRAMTPLLLAFPLPHI